MYEEMQKALIALIILGVVGGVVKLYMDYQAKLLENLWQKRLEAYTKFVKLTSLFPQYPFHNQVNWQDVLQLSIGFRDWYFEGNGIVISRYFREMYFDLQKYIVAAVSADRVNNKIRLNDLEYEDLRKRCSKLRTLMAKELDSREHPIWFRFRKQKEA
jgi:hypothetical protein